MEASILALSLELVERFVDSVRIKLVINANADDLVFIDKIVELFACVLLLFLDELHLFWLEFDHFLI